MNTKLIAGGTLTGLVLAGGIVGAVSAQTVATATGLTEEQIIEIALTEVPGEMQDIEREGKRGNAVYEVEILTEDGTEMEVEIAAETGDVLKVKEDRDDHDCDKDDEDNDEDETDA